MNRRKNLFSTEILVSVAVIKRGNFINMIYFLASLKEPKFAQTKIMDRALALT